MTMYCVYAISLSLIACTKHSNGQPNTTPPPDTTLVNTSHLDYLCTPVTFATGTAATGVYIYSNAPNYTLVGAAGEGFTCLDDVSRAVQVYLRSSKFSTDTATQSKVFNLITFILQMQSGNGYFYNFLLANNSINTSGPTSINAPNWWSWRALQALTEGMPLVQSKNAPLYGIMNTAVNNLIAQIKTDFVNLPETTNVVNGITVPAWLPSGSATDQSSTLILGLIPYCSTTGDTIMRAYVNKLADGIVLMQQGDSTHYPYSCFLSWQNTWHAYGNEQAYALLQAGAFLNDTLYMNRALAEINNFYPWLLQNGFQSSFSLTLSGGIFQASNQETYAQIAYGISPMVFASIEAYKITGQQKYADIAGHLAAWFLGANATGTNIYAASTGICFDGITSATGVNNNSGAESTIEALLALQETQQYPAVKFALNKYKK